MDGDDDSELRELADRARADDVAAGRIRERSLRRAATDDATLAGTLRDLAAAATGLSVRTTGGRTHHGVVAGVGADYVIVRSSAGSEVHLRLRAVVLVRPRADLLLAAASGDRNAGHRHLVDVLAAAVEDRPRVQLVAGTAEPMAGILEAVGQDLATLKLDSGGRAYVGLDALDEVVVEAGRHPGGKPV